MAGTQQDINIRSAGPGDLDEINRVIEAAVMTWPLPDRVKRLSLPSYRYNTVDLDHLEAIVAEDNQQTIIGIAAWEPADTRDAPAGCQALLLHGIYVDPLYGYHGIGSRLLAYADEAAQSHGYDGLLVKAQEYANGFFISQGMEKLEVEDPARHYANRFWKRCRK